MRLLILLFSSDSKKHRFSAFLREIGTAHPDDRFRPFKWTKPVTAIIDCHKFAGLAFIHDLESDVLFGPRLLRWDQEPVADFELFFFE